MSRRRIVCECGGTLPYPTPRQCPHCGAPILSLRQRRWPQVASLLLIFGMFALLAAFTWWMLGGF